MAAWPSLAAAAHTHTHSTSGRTYVAPTPSLWPWVRSVPLVTPVAGKFQLAVDEQGLRLLRSIESPVAPVVVIGPYRSGKSFLLNQLLQVGCGESGRGGGSM